MTVQPDEGADPIEVPAPGTDPEKPSSARPRDLRLALAMRGGVSLAVWIGGAVAEIDTLRRAGIQLHENGRQVPQTDPDSGRPGADQDWKRRTVYMELLKDSGFDQVSVDVLAGASAGGLNAVVYGYVQSLGLGIDWLRDVWQDSGGIWRMLRPTLPLTAPPARTGEPNPPSFWRRLRAPSVLQGDEVFYATVFGYLAAGKHLDALTTRPDDELKQYQTRSLTIDLSATLLDTEQGDPLTLGGQVAALTTDLPSGVGFHFRRRMAPVRSRYTDLPGGADLAGATDATGQDRVRVRGMLARLALAARSTSSFPGAFEPARLRVVDEEFEDPDDHGFPQPSMRGVFSVASMHSDAFEVVDGGIFDNIPIARALLAIQAAPATGPTSRSVLYLDPSPPTSGSLPREKTSNASGFLSVVLRSLNLKQRQETADDEIELIRLHNESELRARGRQDVLALLMGPAAPVSTAAEEELLERYVGWRATTDAERLALVLTQPHTLFMRTSVDFDCGRRLSAQTALQVKDRLVPMYYGDVPDPTDGLPIRAYLAGDATSLLGVVSLLISWVRALEEVLVDQDVSQASRFKIPLYRLRDLSLEIRALSESHFAAAVLERPELDWAVVHEALGQALGAQRGLSLPGGTTTLDTMLDGSLEKEERFWDWVQTALPRSGAGMPRPPSQLEGGTASPGELLGGMCSAAARYRSALVHLGRKVPESPGVSWQQSIFPQLSSPAYADLDLQTAYAVLAAAGGAPGTAQMLRFARITADQETHLSHPTIDQDEVRRRTTMLLRTGASGAKLSDQVRSLSSLPTFGAASKLAGNQLANFAGFLDANWRLHDWTWGRADAAAGLAEIIVRSATRTSPLGGVDDAAREARVKKAAEDLQRDILPEPETWDRPKPALADLPPAYVFALVSRIVHLTYRGVWPGSRSFQTYLRRLVLLVLRPLMVLLPLVARPAALVLAAAALVTAGIPGRVVPDGGTTFARWWLTATLAVIAIGSAVTVWRTGSAWLRWNALVAAHDDDERRGQIAVWRHNRRCWSVMAIPALALGVFAAVSAILMTLASLAQIAWAGWPAVVFNALWAGWLPPTVLAVGLVVGGQVLVGKIRSAPAVRVTRKSELAILGLGLLWGAVVCVPVATRWLPDIDRNGPLAMVALAAVAFFVTGVVHHGWADKRFGVLVAILAATVAGFATGRSGHDGALIVALVVSIGAAASTALVPARENAPGGEPPASGG